MRKTQDELNDLMKRENVDRIWSWSRINCFRNSKYEYFDVLTINWRKATNTV